MILQDSLLAHLITDEFESKYMFLGHPSVMAHMIEKSDYITYLMEQFYNGLLTFKDIDEFSKELAKTFVPNQIFEHCVALVAIAVLQARIAEKAKAYLLDLAASQYSEISMAWHAAEIILKESL